MRHVSFLLSVLCAFAHAAPVFDRADCKHCIDADGDCQNTRQAILIRRSIVPVTFTVRANDWRNLELMDDSTNSSKGDQGPADWMPPNAGYHCAYLLRWSYVLEIYDELTPSTADHDAIDDGLAACNLNE